MYSFPLSLLILTIIAYLNDSYYIKSVLVREKTLSLGLSNEELYYKPGRIAKTTNYIESQAKSNELKKHYEANIVKRKRVAIIGGGLSGLSCAKYLSDAGFVPTGSLKFYTSIL